MRESTLVGNVTCKDFYIKMIHNFSLFCMSQKENTPLYIDIYKYDRQKAQNILKIFLFWQLLDNQVAVHEKEKLSIRICFLKERLLTHVLNIF